jgi:hypothetical protein
MGTDEALAKSEDNDRMNVIGQNGNDGEHYGTFGIHNVTYELNSDKTFELKDVVDILKAMNLTISIYPGEVREDVKKLIDGGFFKKQEL